MKYEEEFLKRVFKRTEGKCHICRTTLSFKNHGNSGARGAWDIEHSMPVSKDGTDHLNNLYPAHIRCNRRKGNSSTRAARAEHGYRAAPLSKKQREENAWISGGIFGLLSILLIPPPYRLAAGLAGALIGALIGHNSEPE